MKDAGQHLEQMLTDGRKAVQMEPKELEEARHRRARLADAIKAAFPGARMPARLR